METKQLARTESVINPEHFKFWVRSPSLLQHSLAWLGLVASEVRNCHFTLRMHLVQDHFEYLRDIGSTKTSEVYAARHHGDKREYAIKKKREKFSNANDRERFAMRPPHLRYLPNLAINPGSFGPLNEFDLGGGFHAARCLHEIKAVIELPKHRNVVGLYRAWQQDGYFFIQMDLCSGGSLSALLRDATDRQEQLDDELLWRIMSDISGGLDFLHGNSVAHLDIKPDNVYRCVPSLMLRSF